MKIFSSNVCALVAGAVVLASVPLGAATVKADKQASAPVTTVTREDLEKTPGARNAESLREALKKPILNEETGSKTRMSEVLVQAEAEHEGVVQGPFMPDVTGAKIYGGKKTSVVDFDQMPQIQTDNYRQAFAKVPGLLVSELSNPALLNLGSRGIGDPHESQNLLVLKDGVPFVVDMIGYPTVYYAPPFESIDRLEFTRGGSSLLYGPQPSGSLNYVTHAPRRDREYGFHTQHVFGSYGLYSTFNSASGTVGRLGYLVNYDHRQGDGYRNHNSDYWLDGGTIKLVLDADKDTRWFFNMDAYSADSGEPGGLTFGPTVADVPRYQDNRRGNFLNFDRVRVERYIPSVGVEHEFSKNTLLTATTYGGVYSRYSKRQNGGGFGGSATLINTNNIDKHVYYTFGTDTRVRHTWEAWDNTHTLTGGFSSFYVTSPITRRIGATADADTGQYVRKLERESIYGSIFAENRFTFGKLSITPGVRVENINQSVKEVQNDAKTALGQPLRDTSDFDTMPLVGLGTEYNLNQYGALYANVSQGYKFRTYSDTVPTDNATDQVSDLEPGKTWTYEVGWRGNPWPWLNWDTSLFWIDYANRFGRVGTTIQNVGRSINKGWDAAVEVDLIGLADHLNKTEHGKEWGSLSLYGNVELLDAKFVSGPQDGGEPQYAPDYMVRAGMIYRWKDRVKLSMLGTFLGDHWANDNNGLFTASNRYSSGYIPAYMVWDLTAEVKVYKDIVTLLGGINNLFNEDYYSRIRANGIEPGVGRNFYAGVSLSF